MNFRDYGALTEEFADYPFFRFDREAQAFFRKWLTNLETTKLRNKHEDPLIVQHLSKYRGLFPKLALVFHLIEVADSNKSSGGYIQLRHAEMAAKWCDYLEAHARRIYGLAKSPSIQAALFLAEKLAHSASLTSPLKNPFSIRDLVRKRWKGLSVYDAAESAVARLMEADWLREAAKASTADGGRPTVEYLINPRIAELPRYEEQNQPA